VISASFVSSVLLGWGGNFSSGFSDFILPLRVWVWPVDRELVILGRTVRPEDVVRIRDWLQAHPHSNRTRLSRELCLAWNWRNRAGRLKDMAARVLLLRLEARGHIQLPPRRTASVNSLRNRDFGQIDHDQSPMEGPLERLRPVRVEPVTERTGEARLFQFLLARYH
jgi:hypothetical protein